LLPHGSQAEEEDSNEDGKPNRQEAEITKLKDGRTALAYKAENAWTWKREPSSRHHARGAVPTRRQSRNRGEAAIAVAGLIAEKTSKASIQCIRTESKSGGGQGLHSNDVALGFAELELRTYIAEPDRGQRNWERQSGGEGSGPRQSTAHQGVAASVAAAQGRADRTDSPSV